MGRKKIEIKLIHQEAVRRATFDKRRIGVIKKAMELSILCDCEISMTITRRDVRDLSIYASDPYDDIVARYQRFKGKHVLFTNDHLADLIPGKANSRESGYLINKKQVYSERYMYKGHGSNNNNGNVFTQPQKHQYTAANVRSLFSMNPMFRVPNITVMPPMMHQHMMRSNNVQLQSQKIGISPSLSALYEVLKDDLPPCIQEDDANMNANESNNNNVSKFYPKRSYEQMQQDAMDLELLNKQIFEFNSTEPPTKKMKMEMETDHDDSDDIKAEPLDTNSASMSVESVVSEELNEKANNQSPVNEESDIAIKIEEKE